MGNKKSKTRMQTAIEYLQTYIWAFLVLTLILIVLIWYTTYGFGTKARVPPGSCFVNRPYGPNTLDYLSLSGNCNGDLPEYVVHFPGTIAGGSSGNWYSDVTNCASTGSCVGFSSPLQYPQAGCNLTINAWSYDSGMPSAGNPGSTPFNTWTTITGTPVVPALGGVVYLWNTTNSRDGNPDQAEFGIEYNDSMLRFEARTFTQPNEYFVTGSFKNRWIMTTIVVNNGMATAYLNGTAVSPQSPEIGCAELVQYYSNHGIIGMWDRVFNGSISNVQMYDTALDANTVEQMYMNGLGGAPIDLNHLIGWWELNGNTNDSSGNGDNGQPVESVALTFKNDYPTPG